MMAAMGTQGFDPSFAMSNSVAVTLPVYIIGFGYGLIQWILKLVMFIDFFRTSDSILEVEEAQLNPQAQS